jgi:HEPN domain-containing protein
MEEKKGLKQSNLETGKRFLGLKSTAYKEYLAARHLLNDNFLHQAAFFTNTCFEKELKAYLFCLDITVNIKHDTFKLLNLLGQHAPKIAQNLNADFIKTITKIYSTRYYEELGPGFNFVIIRNKFLAELDYTFSFLDSLTSFKLGSQKEIPKSNFEMDKENNKVELLRNNYLLNNIDKAAFLNQEDLVYEYRILFNHEILEIFYKIPFNKEHDKFIFEGLKPNEDNKSFIISNH